MLLMGKARREAMNQNNVVRMLMTSGVRFKVLLSLSEGPKTLGEIYETVGSTKSTISHALGDLIEEGLITQDPSTKRYSLTNLGYLVFLQIRNLTEALEVIQEFQDFWLTHDLSGIPEELLIRIGDLRGSRLHATTPEYIKPPHETYMEMIRTSRWIRGVSPVLFSDYPREFLNMAFIGDADIEIVTTTAVYEKLLDLTPPEVVERVRQLPNVRLYTIEENPRVAFTVTDKFISLGLFFPDGTYDMMNDLIGTGERARRWGLNLFEHYRRNARRVL